MSDLEEPDVYITLKRAGEISGLSPNTLFIQARDGKLKTWQPARDLFTTRRWLHEYLMAASENDKGTRKPLPEGYVPPEDRALAGG